MGASQTVQWISHSFHNYLFFLSFHLFFLKHWIFHLILLNVFWHNISKKWYFESWGTASLLLGGNTGYDGQSVLLATTLTNHSPWGAYCLRLICMYKASEYIQNTDIFVYMYMIINLTLDIYLIQWSNIFS